jgi:O-antigen/teichoic acid export membrane protein
VIRLFGTEFRAGAGVVILIGAATILKTTFSLSGNVIKSMGHSNVILANHAVAGVLNVVLNFLLIPELGMIGAAVATSTAIALDGVLPAIELYVWKGLSPLRSDFIEPVLAASLATVGTVFGLGWATDLHYLVILPVGVAYLIIYGLVLMTLGGLQEEDVYILRAIKDRTGLDSPRVEGFVRRFI